MPKQTAGLRNVIGICLTDHEVSQFDLLRKKEGQTISSLGREAVLLLLQTKSQQSKIAS